MNIWHVFGFSGQRYPCPIRPRPGEKPRFWRDSPAHKGVFSHARDIIIPDPRTKSLPIYVPALGTITELVQHHVEWGNTPDFQPFLNYVTVRVPKSQGEFYQLCHIAAASCPFGVGDTVTAGIVLARTGVNGYMTDPRHIHFMVGIYTKKIREGFMSVRIRW